MRRDYSFQLSGNNNRGVLLLHGLTGSPSEVHRVGRGLHERGFSVIAPTLAGHGGTMEELTETRWQDWYESAHEALLRLRGQVGQVYTAGLSMGAVLSLKLAIDFPDISAVGVYGITLKYDGWNISPIRLLTPFLPKLVRLPWLRELSFEETHPFGIKNDSLRERIIRRIAHDQEGTLPATPWKSLFQLFLLNQKVKAGLSRVKCPVILFHATEDDICSINSNAIYVQARVGGVSELHRLKNSYHMVTIDSDRDELITKTADFFERN
ncbi:MAG: alpha/beta fold hydrolase [Candidatus Riflebacteria bacterium]|nr:alpha/beta fold hydrolase [Candidatus Riflebacteria bacterium]